MRRDRKRIYPWKRTKNVKFPTKAHKSTWFHSWFFQTMKKETVSMLPTWSQKTERLLMVCQSYLLLSSLLSDHLCSLHFKGLEEGFASSVLLVLPAGGTNARLGRERRGEAKSCCWLQWWVQSWYRQAYEGQWWGVQRQWWSQQIRGYFSFRGCSCLV